VAAAQYATSHFAPGTVVLYDTALKPHAEYLFARFRPTPIAHHHRLHPGGAPCHRHRDPPPEKAKRMSAVLKHPADTVADPLSQARAIGPLLRDEAPKIEALGRFPSNQDLLAKTQLPD